MKSLLNFFVSGACFVRWCFSPRWNRGRHPHLVFLEFRQLLCQTAYNGMFHGAVLFRPWERIWKSWAPGKCKFFMWLVAHNRCWTADRLLQRGLPHPARCPLCDQADETINHLLVPGIFAREFWFLLLQRLSLQGLSHKMKTYALMTGGRWMNPGWMVPSCQRRSQLSKLSPSLELG